MDTSSVSIIIGLAIALVATGSFVLIFARDKMRADHQWYVETYRASPGLLTLLAIMFFGRSAPASASPLERDRVAEIAPPRPGEHAEVRDEEPSDGQEGEGVAD